MFAAEPRTVWEGRTDEKLLRATNFHIVSFRSSGKSTRENSWVFAKDKKSEPIEIKVSEDKRETQVSIDGMQISKTDPWEYSWEVIGKPKDMKTDCVYEMRHSEGGGPAFWYPCTLESMNEDGTLNLTALMDAADGQREEKEFKGEKAKRCQDIRRRETRERLRIPIHHLRFKIAEPSNPLGSANLFFDDNEKQGLAFYLAVPTPSKKQADEDKKSVGGKTIKGIKFYVARDFDIVVSPTVGASQFRSLKKGIVRAIQDSFKADKTSCQWAIMHGPWYRHEVTLRKAADHRVSLTVDGVEVVNARSQDIDCPEYKWEVKFKLSGKTMINWEVFKQNADNQFLTETGIKKTPIHHAAVCTVSLNASAWDRADLRHAEFFVGDTEWRSLDVWQPPKEQLPWKASREDLQMSYQLEIPRIIDHSAPRGAEYMCSRAGTVGGNVSECPPSFFGQPFDCCDRTPHQGLAPVIEID